MQAPKNARKMVAMETYEQTVVSSGQRDDVGVGARPGLIAGHKVATIIPVWWPETSQRRPKVEAMLWVENPQKMWGKSREIGEGNAWVDVDGSNLAT